MIIFLTTSEHAYTLESLREEAAGVDLEIVPYEQAFSLKQFPLATYVFTDIDRLPLRAQLQAAGLYRQLRRADSRCRVLNDPARVRSRFGLLRALFRRGLNAFNAYRVDEGLSPERFPVFIRFAGSHDRPLTDLLPDQAALDRAIAERVEEGVPEHAMLIVEFCAEPVAEGVYRKLGAYRVGKRVMAAESAMDDSWHVKSGRRGLATEKQFREELDNARNFVHAEHLMHVFELAGIEYGRADFGLVNGRPQVYEINTNPTFGPLIGHPTSKEMTQTWTLVRSNLLAALREADGSSG